MSNHENPQAPDSQPPVPDLHRQVEAIFTDQAVIDAISGARQDLSDNPLATPRQKSRFASVALNAIDDQRLNHLETGDVASEGATPLPKRPAKHRWDDRPSSSHEEWRSEDPRLRPNDEQ